MTAPPRPEPANGVRGRAGFSLVEVLAAAAVLIIATASGAGVVRLAGAVSGHDADARHESDAALQLAWRLRSLPYLADEPGGPSVVASLFPHTSEDGGSAGFYVAARREPWPEACFVAFHVTDAGRVCTVAQFVQSTRDPEADGAESAALAGAGDGWTVIGDDELSAMALLEAPPAALRVEVRSARRPDRPALATLFFLADGTAAVSEP